jgi:RNA recognition motif-containing protein
MVILVDSKGESRGVGFVRMSDLSEALSAITSLNGKSLLGYTLSVQLGLVIR